MNKQELYHQIEQLRQRIGIRYPPPYDSRALCTKAFGLNLDYLDLRTHKLRGMSHIPSRSVVIDIKRTPEEQNFHCMHEVMHHMFHQDMGTKIYSSYEETQADQNPFIEWQANEGAAQFLVPYQAFIPDYIQESRLHAHDSLLTQDGLCKILAPHYFVSPKVISNRIDSLNYEIYQFLHGTPIPQIILLSKTKLKGIGWSLTHEKTYCRTCCSPIEKDYIFCQVCGTQLDDGHPLHKLGKINRGAGYMIYSGAELKESGQAKECLQCKNEEHLADAEFCMICGKPVINRCTSAIDQSVPNEYWQCSHNEPLPGNARYCPYCGSKTTFYVQGILFAYNDDDVLPF